MPTLGFTDTSGVGNNYGDPNRVWLTLVTMPEAGTLSSVHVYCPQYGGGKVKGVVYTDNAGTPDARVAVGAEVTQVSAEWATSAVSGSPALTSGASYWIGMICQDYTSVAGAKSGTGTVKLHAFSTYADPPTSAPTSGYTTYSDTIQCHYITYAAAATGTPLPVFLNQYRQRWGG
jgi:hypothetical protein